MSQIRIVYHLLLSAPELWGRYCFHRCVSGGRGHPISTSIMLLLVRCPFWRDTPSNWSQVPSRWYPSSRQGDTPVQVECPSLTRGQGTPVLGYAPAKTGVPSQDRTSERVLATWWAVCLLCSPRRTVLLIW